MKFISWNVNGLRAVVGKNFKEVFETLDADFFCLQETKMQEGQLDIEFPGYRSYWNYAEKKGYSGTAIFTKHEPLSVNYGIGSWTDETGAETSDHEGRVITLEYPDFYLITVYTPNSQDGLRRLDYRMTWDEEIDIKNPKANRMNAGFTDQERAQMTQHLNAGFIDTFRHFYPTLEGAYSWWSYRFKAREKNAGWRIDYFLVSSRLADRLEGASIHNEIFGSDHCPVEVILK